MEDHKARKAAEGTSKSSKTKAVKVLAEAGKGPSRSQVTVLTGSMVINCVDGTVSSGTPMLVPVYDTRGRVVAMSHVPENLPPPPISVDIPREKAGRCPSIWKNLQGILEDSEAEEYSGKSEQGSNEESGHPTDEKPPSDDEGEGELIPNPELQGLGFKAMLRSVLPSIKEFEEGWEQRNRTLAHYKNRHQASTRHSRTTFSAGSNQDQCSPDHVWQGCFQASSPVILLCCQG